MRVDSISALKAISPTVGDLAELTGYYTPGDGGGGEFYWDNTSSETPNDGTIIQPGSYPAMGRWKRVFTTLIDVSWFGAKGDGTTDDINAILAAVTAATAKVVFAPRTYITTGLIRLSVPLIVDLNGATIKFASSVTTSIPLIAISADNCTVQNGNLVGTFVPDSGAPTTGTGQTGINVGSSTKTISNTIIKQVNISNVQAYGIIASNSPNLTVSGCKIVNTGYISLFSTTTTGSLQGGIIEDNYFDRTGIPPANVKQICVAIQGSVQGANTYTTSSWRINNNKIIVPPSPTDTAAECIEVRYMVNSVINNNIFINGSIGLSIVRCLNITASGNSCFNSVIGLELADSTASVLDSNVVDGNNLPGSLGIMLDGGVGSTYNTVSNNIVSNVKTSCIQVYHNSNYNNIIGGILTQTTAGQSCLNIIGAQGTSVTGVKMTGVLTGDRGVMMDNSNTNAGTPYLTSGTIINGCTFTDFASSAIAVYAPNGGTITGIRITDNTLNSGSMLSSTLTGATISSPYYFGNAPEIIGSRVLLATGTNASAGSATLVAGTITVSNMLVTSTSIIFVSVSAIGGTQGILSYTKTIGTNFTIKSTSNTETSTVAWLIIN